ncbi:hypothetical protein COY60_01305, partial [Candidatus Gracilibacteria bacterium CG_4_10_14_0_8_um_filter_38_28]
IFIIVLISSLFLVSCSDNDDEEDDEDNHNKIARTYNNSFLEETSQTETNSNTTMDSVQKKQKRSVNTRTKAS